jgi:hypothetical protein
MHLQFSVQPCSSKNFIWGLFFALGIVFSISAQILLPGNIQDLIPTTRPFQYVFFFSIENDLSNALPCLSDLKTCTPAMRESNRLLLESQPKRMKFNPPSSCIFDVLFLNISPIARDVSMLLGRISTEVPLESQTASGQAQLTTADKQLPNGTTGTSSDTYTTEQHVERLFQHFQHESVPPSPSPTLDFEIDLYKITATFIVQSMVFAFYMLLWSSSAKEVFSTFSAQISRNQHFEGSQLQVTVLRTSTFKRRIQVSQ